MHARHLSLMLVVGMAAILVALLALAAAPALAGTTASTRYVAPGGDCAGHNPCYATVQAAVDASGTGDTILVAEGTYTGVSAHGSHVQVVYLSKRITIHGGYTTAYADPPDPVAHPTTLDAQGQGHVIYIPAIGSYAHVTLDGLRLTGGYASEAVSGDDTGGGIRADGVSGDVVTIQNCWIGENTAEGGGAGGIAFDFTELVLTGSTVISSTGTGVILWGSDSPVISGSTIAGNSAGGVTIISAAYGNGLVIQGNAFTGNIGNGIYLNSIDSDGGNDVISGNTFDGNGRGLFASSVYTNLRISNNTFQNNINTAFQGHGGGVRLELANAEVLNNTFTGNDADFGGGLSVGNADWAYVLVQGNRFMSNTGGDGGAIHLDGECTTDLQNNLISGNQAQFGGGGVAIDAGTTSVLRGNVLTGNHAKLAGGLYCGSCTVTLERNWITGNSASTKGGGLWFNWPAFLVPQTISSLTNNVIADNSAPTGSGVMIESSNLVMIHNTIAHNSAAPGSTWSRTCRPAPC